MPLGEEVSLEGYCAKRDGDILFNPLWWGDDLVGCVYGPTDKCFFRAPFFVALL